MSRLYKTRLLTEIVLSFLFIIILITLFSFLKETEAKEIAEEVPVRVDNSIPLALSSAINFGETLTGTISVPAGVDTYSFAAGAGDTILARMSASQCCNNRQIQLLKSDGSVLLSTVGYTRVEITYSITATDRYTLSVGFSGGSGGTLTGDYSLHLQRLNGPNNVTPITYGQTTTGTITLAAEFDAINFSASTGDVILARMSAGQCCNNREIRLYGPDGNLLLSNLGYTRVEITKAISIAGNYTFLADFSGGSGGPLTGDYDFYLQRLDSPSNSTPITRGQTMTGTIELPAEFDSFNFSANAGDVLLVRMASGQCCNNREIRLYKPNGSLVISNLGYTRVDVSQTISDTGDYALLVDYSGGSGGSLTGDYSLHLQRLNEPGNAISITYGQTKTGTISLAAELDAFSFSANADSVISVGLSASQCCNYRRVKLYTPDGNLLTSNLGYPIFEFTQTIPYTGSHTLLVDFTGGSGGSLKGDYSLSLACINPPCSSTPPMYKVFLPLVLR